MKSTGMDHVTCVRDTASWHLCGTRGTRGTVAKPVAYMSHSIGPWDTASTTSHVS
jgi:hypothetical protein